MADDTQGTTQREHGKIIHLHEERAPRTYDKTIIANGRRYAQNVCDIKGLFSWIDGLPLLSAGTAAVI